MDHRRRHPLYFNLGHRNRKKFYTRVWLKRSLEENVKESAKIACYLNMRSECLLTTDDKTDEHVFPEMSVLTTDLEALFFENYLGTWWAGGTDR